MHDVGFVGAGQLARMAGEAASALGLSLAVLAEREDDSACTVAAEVLVGTPSKRGDLRALADRCGVVTFDHEQVDLGLVAEVGTSGAVFRPGTGTLEFAVDKARMRTGLAAEGIPVPEHVIVDAREDGRARRDIAEFAAAHGWPLVLKAARGGYDGKGVWPVRTLDDVDAVLARHNGVLVAEEHVEMQAELAVMVARSPSGESVAWPPVETAQIDGVCREILVPGRLTPEVVEQAEDVGRHVADIVGSEGVLAVELFWTERGLLVNEIAARPHNSGHWTIEGAVTSQFENHLRAVLDLPLGLTDPSHAHVATVNVFGGPEGTDPAPLLGRALGVPGVHVHLYGKEPRTGRKLGHVTACGDDPEEVRARAWSAASALDSPIPEGIPVPRRAAR